MFNIEHHYGEMIEAWDKVIQIRKTNNINNSFTSTSIFYKNFSKSKVIAIAKRREFAKAVQDLKSGTCLGDSAKSGQM